MATSTGRTHCVTCGQERIAYKCEGCSGNFCFDHLADHRRALGEQLDKVEDERNSFRQTLTEQAVNPQKHSLIQQINKWEQDSINKIQQTADKARQLLIEHIRKIEIKLSELTEQLKQTRKENNFHEIHLNQLKNKLKELKDELNKLSNISIQQDSSSFINKISVVISSRGTPVDTLHQRPTEGPPTTNTGSSFGFSFSKGSTSGPTQPLQFQKPPSTQPSTISFPNPTSTNVPRFAFRNLPTANPPNFSSNQSTGNPPPVRQPLESSTVTPSTHKQETSKNAPFVNRSDPNSPFYSLISFEELKLKPDLLKGIYNMGFRSPSKIQADALPHLLGNPPRNLIAQSKSGTGKTVAFSIAILSRIDPSIRSLQALILAPTFELAMQIGSVIEKLAQYLPYIKIAYAVRDPKISKRANRIDGQILPEPIAIGTPGTVEDWCRELRVINLSQLRICCIDEADFMIATNNFQQTCVNIVRDLNRSNCQIMLFSATYSDEMMALARKIVPNPFVLRLTREKQTLVNIRQFFIRCYEKEQKYNAIEQIYASLTVGQAMIFCRTIETALDLVVRMERQKHSVREIMAILDIEQRKAVIEDFRKGDFRVLISTDIAARGLDVNDVTLVINYDIPVTVDFQPDYETYLHRIGRCGRFGKLGYAFNLIGSEKDCKVMKEIEKHFSHPIEETTIEGLSQLEQDQL